MTIEIISRVTGNLGHITLNRPKALNALSQAMVDEISRLLQIWERDPNIGAVLLDGAGERAFCAGGDVVMLHDSGKAGDKRAETFWREEYALNELIYRYSKPYICLIDGGGDGRRSRPLRPRTAPHCRRHHIFCHARNGHWLFPRRGRDIFSAAPKLGGHGALKSANGSA